MNRDFVGRARRALEVPEGYVPAEVEAGGGRKELRIVQRRYPILWDEWFSLNAAVLYSGEYLAQGAAEEEGRQEKEADAEITRYPECFYIEGVCRKQGTKIARFTVSGEVTLLEFARRLSKTASVSKRSFFAMNDTIYLESPEEPNIKFARLLLVKKYGSVESWEVQMQDSIGNIREEIFYFNGSYSATIQLERAYLSCKRMGSYLALRHLASKSLLCKCCSKRNADRMVVGDPILPTRCKSICAQCFTLLFMDRKGGYRYGKIEYEMLY
jgi:hypothetical protein